MTTGVGTRYAALFQSRASRNEGVFVPFFMLGDPDLETSALLLRAALAAGADALEVGIPFSDPIADGPAIQRAALRARAAGATAAHCLTLVAELRAETRSLPIGLLTYANLVVHRGMDHFYARAREAGLDSVLIADVPVCEAEPFAVEARENGIAPILIAPPDASDAVLAMLSQLSEGYTYCVARKGVTGATTDLHLSHAPLFESLRAHHAPPPLLGFGISRPAHVASAIAAGARGAISGSAIATLIDASSGDREAMIHAVSTFVREMKAATRP